MDFLNGPGILKNDFCFHLLKKNFIYSFIRVDASMTACVCRETTTKVKDLGGHVFSYFATYYEDHIQPVKDSYAEWASDIKGSLWEKIQTTFDHYMPKKAN